MTRAPIGGWPAHTVAAAREWLQDCGADCEDRSDAEIMAETDRQWDGGLRGFLLTLEAETVRPLIVSDGFYARATQHHPVIGGGMIPESRA